MPRTILVLTALVVPVVLFAGLLGAEPEKGRAARPAAATSADPKDWPMYNADVLGTRHNVGEKTLSKDNVVKLVEKWRFPATLSLTVVGVIHATPVVVNGYVYFATATTPTVYKLTPDGKLKWSYRPTAGKRGKTGATFGVPDSGFLNSPLVTGDTVYAADAGGMIYAIDRATGKERWVVDTRAKPFPGAHSSNCLFAAPILARVQLPDSVVAERSSVR